MRQYFETSRNLQQSRTDIQMTQRESNPESSQAESPSLPRVRTLDVMIQSIAATAAFGYSWIDHNQKYNVQLQGWKDYINHRYFRKLIITLIGIFFAIYGSTILYTVLSHFHHAVLYCSRISMQRQHFYDFQINHTEITFDHALFLERPELFFYDQCEFPVYPFDTVCDCRVFRITAVDICPWSDRFNCAREIKRHFNVSIMEALKSVMTNFRMMEKLKIQGIRRLFGYGGYTLSELNKLGITTQMNLTDDIFKSKKLQVLSIHHLQTTSYLSEKIGELSDLQYLVIVDTEIVTFPESIGRLNQLQYLELRGYDVHYQLESIPPLCTLSKLKLIKMEQSTFITTFPHCLGRLESLEIVILTYFPNLNNISLEIFNLPNLRILNLELTGNLSLDYLMNANHIDPNTNFVYRDSARFELDRSGLCMTVTNNDNYANNYKRSFIDFINTTGACNAVCGGNTAFIEECRATNWQNGFCNEHCNNEECEFDGGDCVQLCPFEDPINDYKELGNGECNIKYNRTECNYDYCDCIPDTYYDVNRYENQGCIPLIFNETLCDISFNKSEHKCHPEWVNDGWCDSNCQYTPQCANDGYDCINACDKFTNCYRIFKIFELGATLIMDDQKISQDELCGLWPFIQTYFQNVSNCDEGMEFVDLNGDEYVDFHECIVSARHQWDLGSEEKANQVNCSSCPYEW